MKNQIKNFIATTIKWSWYVAHGIISIKFSLADQICPRNLDEKKNEFRTSGYSCFQNFQYYNFTHISFDKSGTRPQCLRT